MLSVGKCSIATARACLLWRTELGRIRRRTLLHSHRSRTPCVRLIPLMPAELAELAPPVSMPSFAIARSGAQRASCGGSNLYVEG